MHAFCKVMHSQHCLEVLGMNTASPPDCIKPATPYTGIYSVQDFRKDILDFFRCQYTMADDFIYQYHHLEEGEIRLAQLHVPTSAVTASFTPAITIVHKRLVDVKGQYEALSYVWGNTNPGGMRLLGCLGTGRFLWIGENLWSALRMLIQRRQAKSKKSSGTDLVWIDAICINQADEREKGHQVMRMRDIYQLSARTVAHLGEEKDDSRLFMWFMKRTVRKLMERFRRIHDEAAIRARIVVEYAIMADDEGFIDGAVRNETAKIINQIFAEFCDDPVMSKLLDNRRIMKSFALLLARPYFQRIWTVQELAAAGDSTLYCGSHFCDPVWMSCLLLNTLHPAGIQLTDYIDDHATRMSMCRGIAQFTATMSLRGNLRDNSYRGLHFLLQSFRPSLATNELDKVYALIGLSGEKHLEGFPIDYTKTKAEVYLKAAKAIIFTLDGPGEHVLYEAARSENALTDCPSWVPDWTEMPIRTNLGLTLSATAKWYCDASGERRRAVKADGKSGRPERMSIRPSGKTLHMKAAVLQQIAALGSPPAPNSEGSAALNTIHLANVIEDLARYKDELGSSAYPPTGQPIDTALGILLEADQPRQTDGVTNWNEEPGTRSFLYGVDFEVLLERAILGKPYRAFAAQIYLGCRSSIHNMIKATVGRRFAVSDSDRSFAALVPTRTQIGDWICILERAMVPFILRKNPEDGTFTLVGDAYVHGMMLGEMFEDEENLPVMQDIVIR
ncbi:het-domain protein [Cladorrhinum samala]|uniref:Het-domain protein n=1 Tax=Cladorrhinum samala TaxID=585594 RepID=A0AAV9HT79_9PEZI|nr:het-domain protein [Cladorrhinum samala]